VFISLETSPRQATPQPAARATLIGSISDAHY
jgi:hypothetical protein